MEIVIQAFLTAALTAGLLQGIHYARQWYYERKFAKVPPAAEISPDYKELASYINTSRERLCDGPCRQPTRSYVEYDDGSIECFSCAGKI